MRTSTKTPVEVLVGEHVLRNILSDFVPTSRDSRKTDFKVYELEVSHLGPVETEGGWRVSGDEGQE